MSENHLIPNSTQIPNVALDLLLPFLHEGEARVLLYIFRRTYGFQRESDRISLDQFVSGMRSDDQQFDFGAGVSRRAAITALEMLKRMGIVEQMEGGQGRSRIPVYRLNVKCEMMQQLHLIAQYPENAREKIAQILHLYRSKGATHAPYDRKPLADGHLDKKVQVMHLSKKVQVTTEKGASDILQPIEIPNEPSHTKPSITKPRKKDLPLENTNVFSSPPGEQQSSSASQTKSPKTPKSQQPGELDADLIALILSMKVKAFHCLAEELHYNEVFWDAQIVCYRERGCTDFGWLIREVDTYYAAHADGWPRDAKAARARMKVGLGIAFDKWRRERRRG